MNNRIIKFRVWDTDFKTMVLANDIKFVDGLMIGAKGVNWDSKVVVMQFTGLTDKSGKEIYEGDIVSVVNMHDENIQWWANGLAIPFIIEWRYHAFELPSSEEDISFNWEITGNIYEQPEKLTVKEGDKSNSSQG